ncbi:MAG: hypothetical protein ACREDM_11200 [Methylocella sp.]
MIVYMTGLLTICAFVALGAWLEGIGGKHNFFDEFLTPLPLGLLGIGLVFYERLPA